MKSAVNEKENERAIKPAGTKGYLFVKRVFDISVAFAAGVLLLIPLIIIGALIKVDSRGPILFKQQRMGQHGKVFTIYKLRTMSVDAPAEVPTMDFENPEKYMTGLGGFLRKTSIDEIPQLFNILKGDMSFVGYRPVCLTEEKLNALRMELGVFETKPGLTGLAQVSGRDDIDYREKAILDSEYVKNRSLKLDAECIFKTVAVVFSGKGAK